MLSAIQLFPHHKIESKDAGEMGISYRITNMATGQQAILVTDQKYHIVGDGKPYSHYAYAGDDKEKAIKELVRLVG